MHTDLVTCPFGYVHSVNAADVSRHAVATYQGPAEEHRASAVVGHSPADKLLNVVQLAARLYCPLQLVLQTLLEVLRDFLWTPHRKTFQLGVIICAEMKFSG